MTTVAWDGKILASDSLATFGNIQDQKPYKKIFQRDGIAYGVCGATSRVREWMDWYEAGQDPAEFPSRLDSVDYTVLVIERRKFSLFSDSPYPEDQNNTGPFAIGTGADFALAAMALGEDAVGAVKLAIKFDVYSGGKIQRIDTTNL